MDDPISCMSITPRVSKKNYDDGMKLGTKKQDVDNSHHKLRALFLLKQWIMVMSIIRVSFKSNIIFTLNAIVDSCYEKLQNIPSFLFPNTIVIKSKFKIVFDNFVV